MAAACGFLLYRLFKASSSETIRDRAQGLCLRLWLAERRLHPSDFQIAADNQPGFKISFSSEQDAATLDEFCWPPG
jgi:hypothetical protein